MVRITEAIFKDGVLKPIGKLDLRENEQVRVTIESCEPDREKRQEAIARFRAGREQMNLLSTEPYPTRQQLHERD